MRKYIIGWIICGVAGYILFTKGITVTTWEYYALLSLLVAGVINETK